MQDVLKRIAPRFDSSVYTQRLIRRSGELGPEQDNFGAVQRNEPVKRYS